MALKPSPITLASAQAQLASWNAALEAASTGASYSIEGQTVTRQDVTLIRAEIRRWHNTVVAITQRLNGTTRPCAVENGFGVCTGEEICLPRISIISDSTCGPLG